MINLDVEVLFDAYVRELEYEKTTTIFQDHWKYINPLLEENYDDNDFYNKNLIELLDGMFENIIQVCSEKFFYNKSSLGILARGRRGEHSDVKELYPPSSIKTAIDYAGMHMVRFTHYGHIEHFEDECDSIHEGIIRKGRKVKPLTENNIRNALCDRLKAYWN